MRPPFGFLLAAILLPRPSWASLETTRPPCQFTEEERKVISVMETCEEELEEPRCLAKCILDKMGWTNGTGYPDAWKAQQQMSELPEGQYREAALRLVSCIKTRARIAIPEEEECKTYKTMGICMKRAIELYCGPEFVPSPSV